MIRTTILSTIGIGFIFAALASPAAIAQQAPADREDAALAHAQCMRDNGYAEFPDPTPDGQMRFLVEPGNAERFEKAAAACRHLAPEGMCGEDVTPEQLDALLGLSQCMRENGVANFPDPEADGRFNLQGVSNGPGDPRIAAAMDVCREASGLGRGGRIMIGG